MAALCYPDIMQKARDDIDQGVRPRGTLAVFSAILAYLRLRFSERGSALAADCAIDTPASGDGGFEI